MQIEAFDQKVASNPRPLIVYFWATWCMPCRTMSPALKEIRQDYQGQVDLLKINADESQELVKSLKIFGIPTLLFFQNGQEIGRKTGAQNPDTLRQFFEAALAGEAPRTQITSSDRFLRIFTAIALLILGITTSTWILIGISAVAFFSAIYDRCPLWQTIAPRIKAFLYLSLII